MCGRYGLAVSGEVLATLLGLDEVPDVKANQNIAPTTQAPVARIHQGQRELAIMGWGLLPVWARDRRMAARMINARAESVDTKPAFRQAFSRRRCLVVSDGFYEWKRLGRQRQPYHIGLGEGRAFAMAGIWERWKDPEDQWVLTFSIITTTANELVGTIHDRMPVILPPAAFEQWLDPEIEDPNTLKPFLRPFPQSEMVAWPVSPKVNNVRYHGDDCRLPLQTLL